MTPSGEASTDSAQPEHGSRQRRRLGGVARGAVTVLAVTVAVGALTIARDASASADDASADLRVATARLEAAEEQIASQSVDLASAQTTLRVLRRDLEVGAELPALEFATERTDPGTPVLVVGSPFGLEGSVVSGVVSSYRVEEGQEQMQLSAPVNPGNSGGPVTDEHGTVLGVVVAKYVGFEVEGLSFAVPSDVVCATFDVCS